MIARKPWPWDKINPVVGSKKLTVCISAICESENAIICACDRMISMGGYMRGGNMADKTDPFHYHWFSQFAANNISAITPIHQHVKTEEAKIGIVETCDEVSNIAKNAYKTQRLIQIEDEILASYGLTWDLFATEGRTRLNDRDFEIVTEKIRAYDLELDMLVVAFDARSRAHIFTMSNPGTVSNYDKLSFWAIGSGQHLAMASLFAGCYDRDAKLENCVAQVLSAKFSAESAEGVGEKTFLFVYTADDKVAFLDSDLEADVRAEWSSLPRVPEKCLGDIKAWISTKRAVVSKAKNKSAPRLK